MRCAGISRWSAGAWRRRQSPKGDPHERGPPRRAPPQARPDPLGGSIAVPGERGVVMNRPNVLVIGCGFGGIEAVRALSKAGIDITLVDRTNHHLFQPLLYQVATAGLSAPAVSAPIRHVP